MTNQIPGMEQFPKMVYPHGPNVHHTGAGSPETEGFAGVIVKNEDEEKWVMDGNKLEDFGKPKAEIDKNKKEAKPKEGDANWIK